MSDSPSIEPELIDVRTVAQLLGCSVRTVWRLRDAGKIPQPLILTTGLVRWRRSTLLRGLVRLNPSPTTRVGETDVGSN
jgi:predicted DNA-binding transcriptional regulator AlpA